MDSTAGGLQHLLDRLVARGTAHGALAAVQSGDRRIAATASAGHADANRSVPLTEATPYFLASVTKVYTAVVVVQLAREGTIRLRAPAMDYLPTDLLAGLHVVAGVDHGPAITVEHLLFQTSGLPDYFEGHRRGRPSLGDRLRTGKDRDLSLANELAIARTLSPAFPPGADGAQRAYYSDTNFALLGELIRTVDAPPAESFRRRIIDPLGLTTTFLYDHRAPQPAPATLWHRGRPLHLPRAMSSFPAEGSMVSTLAECLTFLRALFTHHLVTPEELAYLTGHWNPIFFPIRYAGGLMRFAVPRWLAPVHNPGELLGHSGSTGSFAFYCPQRDLYLAGTLNQTDSPARPFRLMGRMAAIAAGGSRV